MARAVVVSRYSIRAERSAPANRSPFRSCNYSARYIAALQMVAKREEEIEAIEKALSKATDPKVQKRLSERLLATTNNLRSWRAYFDGDNEKEEACYREPRAVIIP